VERTPDVKLRIAESADNIGLDGTADGGLIGMLVGVLGGPLGMLLGWGAGALIGSTVDLSRATTAEDALTALARAIRPGSTALLAAVAEPAVAVIDGEMGKLSDEVARRRIDDVMNELDAADDAAEAATREARRATREHPGGDRPRRAPSAGAAGRPRDRASRRDLAAAEPPANSSVIAGRAEREATRPATHEDSGPATACSSGETAPTAILPATPHEPPAPNGGCPTRAASRGCARRRRSARGRTHPRERVVVIVAREADPSGRIMRRDRAQARWRAARGRPRSMVGAPGP
jgi:uncharacterized membrane protein